MSRDARARWRLMLGRYADRQLGGALSRGDGERDQALDYLYGREYARRGIKPGKQPKGASLDPSQVKALDWLARHDKPV